MNTNTIIAIIVVLVLVAIGGFFLLNRDNSQNLPPTSDTAGTPQNGTPVVDGTETVDTQGGQTAQMVTINYTSTGFSPNSVTIKKGDSVTFVNQSGGSMWVASAPHPEHTGYDGTSRQTHCAAGYSGPAPFDQCASGNSFTFTFDKVGTWPYHNHFGSEDGGTIIVQ